MVEVSRTDERDEAWERVVSLPGMTTREEREYLARWAEERYQERGAIVDLGCWMGSLAAALAAGLDRRRPATSARVYAFDLFQFSDWMTREFRRLGLPLRNEGESFREDFDAFTRPWKDRLIVEGADLSRPAWTGGAIEMLVVDVMKSWTLASSTLRGFFPYLIPGISLVMHQDFAHFATPWVALVMYRLRDYFECVLAIEKSGSVVFRLVRSIPESLLKVDYCPSLFSSEEASEAIAWAKTLATPTRRGELTAARAFFSIESRRHDDVPGPLTDLLDDAGCDASIQDRMAGEWIAVYPGMSSPAVRARLTKWAQDAPAGTAIVDLGCWLGAATVSLAEGLRRRSKGGGATGQVDAFDLFRMEAWMKLPLRQSGLSDDVPAGTSFRAIFDRLTRAWQPWIAAHEGPLEEATWTGAPISLLVVDHWYWNLTGRLLEEFLARLVPGEGRVVVCTLNHEALPVIALVFHRLQPWLAVEEVILPSAVVFRSTGPIPASAWQRSHDPRSYSPIEMEEAFGWAASLVPGTSADYVRLATLAKQIDQDDWLASARDIRSMGRDGIDRCVLAEVMQRWLDRFRYSITTAVWWENTVSVEEILGRRTLVAGPAEWTLVLSAKRFRPSPSRALPAVLWWPSDRVDPDAAHLDLLAWREWLASFAAGFGIENDVIAVLTEDGGAWESIGVIVLDATLADRVALVERLMSRGCFPVEVYVRGESGVETALPGGRWTEDGLWWHATVTSPEAWAGLL